MYIYNVRFISMENEQVTGNSLIAEFLLWCSGIGCGSHRSLPLVVCVFIGFCLASFYSRLSILLFANALIILLITLQLFDNQDSFLVMDLLYDSNFFYLLSPSTHIG